MQERFQQNVVQGVKYRLFFLNLILCIMNDMYNVQYIVSQQIICIDSLYVCALRNWRAISSSIWFE